MARLPRIVITGCPYHITQRGNNRQDVFFIDDDRARYLSILRKQSNKYNLKIIAYCLMVNHVHIVAVPGGAESLSKAIGRTHWEYTKYINHLHDRSGHLWHNRFFSCPLDDEHFFNALVYVERNPVRAKLVNKAWEHEWSSADAHVEGFDRVEVLDMVYWRKMVGDDRWRDFLIREDDQKEVAALRSNTNRGRPLGNDTFLNKIEKKTGRRMRLLPGGRPKKTD